MQSGKNFRIEFDSCSLTVKWMVKHLGAKPKGTSGPRFVVDGGRVFAIDIPTKNVRHVRTQLIQLARSFFDVRLCYRQCMLPLKCADKKDLDEFLDHPEQSIFVVANQMILGIQLCLQNAISLTTTSDSLITNKPHAVFFMYTALEELGKAALLVDALKQSPAKVQFIKVIEFRSHTAKLLRAVEGLAGEIILTDKHSAERTHGALDALNQAARLRAGNKGAIAFRFLYKRLVSPFQFLRDMGEFFREAAIYVEYSGVNKLWVNTWTRFTPKQIIDLNETIREYCKEYITQTSTTDVSKIPKLEHVLPIGWFDRLTNR